MPKIVDRVERRAEITDAVLEIVSEVGVDAVTIRDVATRCGWSTGVIHHYIGGRDDLLLAALKRATWKSGVRYHEVARRTDLSAFERLHQILRLNLPIDPESMALVRIHLFFYAEVAAKDSLAPTLTRYIINWRKSVESCVIDVMEERGIETSKATQIGNYLVALADGFATHAMMTGVAGMDDALDAAPPINEWIESALTIATKPSVAQQP